MDKTTINSSLKQIFSFSFAFFFSFSIQANAEVMAVSELENDLAEIERSVFGEDNWNLIIPHEAFNAKRGVEFLYCSIVGDILGNTPEAKKNYNLGMSFLDEYAKQVVESDMNPKTSVLVQQISLSMANYQFVANKDVFKGMIYENLAQRITGGWIQIGKGKDDSIKGFQESYSRYCKSI